MDGKKRCFVLMGFGVKVDYRSNRSLDLDKTYKIIKRAVEAAGLECIRADDIVHSGVIDKPMYENLLSADVAIADLSTSNENAIYELGVRHALKPRTTIVIAEKQFKFPFDLTHVVIRHYEHLGTGIDFDEAERLQNELTKAILAITAASDSVDSPVYTYLPDLIQPAVRIAAKLADPGPPPAAASASDPGSQTFTILMEAFHEACKQGDFLLAKKYWKKSVRAGRTTPTSCSSSPWRPIAAVTRRPWTRSAKRGKSSRRSNRKRAAIPKRSDSGARFTSGSGRKRPIARRSIEASPPTSAAS